MLIGDGKAFRELVKFCIIMERRIVGDFVSYNQKNSNQIVLKCGLNADLSWRVLRL